MKRLTLEVDGQMVDCKEQARIAGISWPIAYQRIKRGWPLAQALYTPAGSVKGDRTLEQRLAYHRHQVAWHQGQADKVLALIEAPDRERAERANAEVAQL